MKKKVMEYIDNFIGNSIYDILKFIFFLLIPSGMITTFVETRKKYRTIKKSSRYLNGWRQLPSRAILLQIMPLGSCIRTEN